MTLTLPTSPSEILKIVAPASYQSHLQPLLFHTEEYNDKHIKDYLFKSIWSFLRVNSLILGNRKYSHVVFKGREKFWGGTYPFAIVKERFDSKFAFNCHFLQNCFDSFQSPNTISYSDHKPYVSISKIVQI